MINAKIISTILSADEKGLMMQFLFSDKINGNISLGPIRVTNINDIYSIMSVVGVSCWEYIKNSPVSIDVEDKKIVKIANIYDNDIYLEFLQEKDDKESETNEKKELS